MHLQWRLHDRIARQSPKLGEIVAFRNVVPSIPLDTAVDEISIQALITQLGYRLVYEPRAVVYNRGPATVRDFLRQRRRIYAGHLRVREQQAYSAPTMSAWRAARALRGSESFATPRAAVWSLGTVGLEATARALGRYDVIRGAAPTMSGRCAPRRSITSRTRLMPRSAQRRGVPHRELPPPASWRSGLHASRQLTRRVADRIQQALGPAAMVSAQQSGTAVALLPGDREAAERAAQGCRAAVRSHSLSRSMAAA